MPFDFGPPPLIFPKPAIVRPADEDLLRFGGDPVRAAHMAHKMKRAAAAGSLVPDFAYVASSGRSVDGLSASTYNFTNVPFGDANPNRKIVVVLGSFRNGGNVGNLSSATIGGVSATILANVSSGGESLQCMAAIIIASVPTDTTGTVSLTWGVATTSIGIAVYRMISSTTSAYAVGTSATYGTATLSRNTTAGGWAVGCSYVINGTAHTWTGLTENYEVDTRSGEWFSAASVFPTVAATPRTITVTQNIYGCSASFEAI